LGSANGTRINGKKIGDSVLSPALTEYNKRSLYMTFDLGVGSALTKFVAEYRATGDHAALRSAYARH
jgi:hypothetical protein